MMTRWMATRLSAVALPLVFVLGLCTPPAPTLPSGLKPCGSVSGWSCSVVMRVEDGGTWAEATASTTKGAAFINMTLSLEMKIGGSWEHPPIWTHREPVGKATTRKTIRAPWPIPIYCEDRPGEYRWHLVVKFSTAPKAEWFKTTGGQWVG